MVRRPEIDPLVDALLVASQALVGIAARSIADTDGVTLAQWRVLVLVASSERLTVSDLAEELDVHPASATRLCDRLVAKQLVERATPEDDRRQVVLHLAPAGQRLVRQVTGRRRHELATIAARMGPERLQDLVRALQEFSEVAGQHR